ncbi:MAG: chemotaxis protein CheX [Acidobacteriia bacterium]|nr:chemotaxis protein CheX [Terriglobia bacterium]
MPVTFEIDAHQTDVARIVEDVFRTMLCLEVATSETGDSSEPGLLTAAVQFVGDWKGAVLLRCSPRQAFAFTTSLIPSQKPSRFDEDVRDALGELANMVGGNLKSVLPPGVALSMPSVVEGNHYALHICGRNASKTFGFSSELGPFWVTLVQVSDQERA